MKRFRVHDASISLGTRFEPELRVIEYVSTKKGDAERGPMMRMRSSEARIRLLQAGELAWIQGPRRQELAVVVIDESIPAGSIALRDIAGVTVTEKVRVSKPDTDTPVGKRHFG
jgi:hypothetical protein